MMYDEQSEVAERVTAVGKAAVASSLAKRKTGTACLSSKMKAVNSSGIFRSHPVSLASLIEEEKEDCRTNSNKKNSKHAGSVASQEVAELQILMAAQVADAARQQRRADAMEAELAEMKKLLCALAPAHVRNQLQPIVEVKENLHVNEQEEFFEPAEEALEEISVSDTTVHAMPAVESLKSIQDSIGLRLVCNENTGSVVATFNVPGQAASSTEYAKRGVVATTTSHQQQRCRITRGVAAKEACVTSSAVVDTAEETILANWV